MLKILGIIVLAFVVAVVVTAGAGYWAGKTNKSVQQANLQPFYTPPNPVPPGPLGSLVKSEPITGLQLKHANAFRVMYRTEDPDHTPRVSSGMIFVPTAPAPAGGRPVVAWAHGTVGQGLGCAPSRQPNPLNDMSWWLQAMLDKGWVVTATDYAGLGTPGQTLYLVGKAESNDVVNSVRMARDFPGTNAGNRFVVWGHSQGGHSSLWTGHYAGAYAPELKLLGVAAAAPAAEISALLQEQWQSNIGWVIGSDVMASWPAYNPKVQPSQIATQAGLDNYVGISQACNADGAIDAQIQDVQGNDPFKMDPQLSPEWNAEAKAQTVPPLPPSMPVYINQSVTDGIVTGTSNALLEEKWCKAGSKLNMVWLGPLVIAGSTADLQTHLLEAVVGGPGATGWISQRFDNKPAPNTCGQPIPIPATPAS